MTNKAQLIEALSERLGDDKKVAAQAVDGLVDIIIRTVNKGEKVNITGFGVFEKRARAARTARNPRTGEAVKVKKTNVPAFRAGTTFKDVISGTKKLPKATPVKRAAGTRATATKTAAAAAPAKATTTRTTRAAAAKPAATTTRTRATAAKPAAKATATKAAPKTTAAKTTAAKATTAKATPAKATTTRTRTAAAKPAAAKTTAAKTTAAKAPAKRTSAAKKK
ncbi:MULTISPECIES: HU family DNA-binding protein [unclassified Amycolatopsis]|uniref:HU family DNA-binding protein n=1 Tax=unclassified Amycolatopsis TaxID=2618356 RepID=UPI0028759709|nr:MULTISPECIES: HU family DNA-binding protein [unclassified Amycolatopsis]MDS0138202.1 HU family DNA-binding protein [Amycolatopsis sp. 505]MDS0149177.1 HU family DNA-binding protein [Amycolatopsis sp. CM201R]